MQKKEILVLGGGISGLSLLWYLRQYLPEAHIRLLEKSARVGGVIDRTLHEGVIFDQGPKTFRRTHSAALLKLIDEVDLQDQLLFSTEQARKRYVYSNQRLHEIPTHPLHWIRSSFTRKALPGMLQELFVKKGTSCDETIGTFMQRRFGEYISENFVEPFVTGICGGDIHKLSMEAYFPMLKRWEQQHGSMIKALFFRQKSGSKEKGGLFNLKGGLATLTERLGTRLQQHIHLQQEVKQITGLGKKMQVDTQQETFVADQVFLALPLSALKKVTLPFTMPQELLEEYAPSSFVSLSCAYKEDVLPVKGFGYLVPSKEKEKILGVLFDTATFPTLDEGRALTKLTVMMGGVKHPQVIDQLDQEIVDTGLDALRRHLGIEKAPEIYQIFRYPKAIPQYPVDHHKKLKYLKEYVYRECPQLTLAGSYLEQAAVNACIAVSQQVAEGYARC